MPKPCAAAIVGFILYGKTPSATNSKDLPVVSRRAWRREKKVKALFLKQA